MRRISQGSFLKHVDKIFRKTNISYLLIRTRTCTYQTILNISFSENFAYVPLYKKCLYSELFWSVFSRIWPEYEVSLRIQSECGKIRTRIAPNKDTLRSVVNKWYLCTWSISVAVLSVVLDGDVIICSKELKKENSKYFFC